MRKAQDVAALQACGNRLELDRPWAFETRGVDASDECMVKIEPIECGRF
jgi:hypothetical protein